jgi:hypothetical protein
MVSAQGVRELAITLPRTKEAFVRGCLKFRVGQIVYVALSRDQTIMGFAFPREWRPVLVDGEPDKFMLPEPSDMRYNWLRVRLAAIDAAEMHDLVVDAWQMVVPKSVADDYHARQRPTAAR